MDQKQNTVAFSPEAPELQISALKSLCTEVRADSCVLLGEGVGDGSGICQRDADDGTSSQTSTSQCFPLGIKPQCVSLWGTNKQSITVTKVVTPRGTGVGSLSVLQDV